MLRRTGARILREGRIRQTRWPGHYGRGSSKDQQICMHAAYVYPCGSFSSLADLYVHARIHVQRELKSFPRSNPGLNNFSHPPPATSLSSSSSWTSLVCLLLPLLHNTCSTGLIVLFSAHRKVKTRPQLGPPPSPPLTTGRVRLYGLHSKICIKPDDKGITEILQ